MDPLSVLCPSSTAGASDLLNFADISPTKHSNPATCDLVRNKQDAVKEEGLHKNVST